MDTNKNCAQWTLNYKTGRLSPLFDYATLLQHSKLPNLKGLHNGFNVVVFQKQLGHSTVHEVGGATNNVLAGGMFKIQWCCWV